MDLMLQLLLAFVAGSIATILVDRARVARRNFKYKKNLAHKARIIAEYEATRMPTWP